VILFGVSGRARNGKTTVADSFYDCAVQRGLTARQYSIGDLVLEFCIRSGRLQPKTREELNAAELHTLVYVGQREREKDPYFWLRKVRYAISVDNPDVAIIPNIRMPEEVDFVREHDGYLIRVIALNPNGSQFISPDRDANDPTETELHDVRADYVLTAYRGQVPLLRNYAGVVFRHIKGEIGE